MSDVTLRFYRDSDEEGILRLLQDASGRWPRVDTDVDPIDHLRWKLRSDERALRFHIVAEAGGRIVGARLALALRVKLGPRDGWLRQGIDIAVHPAFRGRRITERMQQFHRELFREAFDLYLGGLSGHPALVRLRGRRAQPLIGDQVDVLTLTRPYPSPPQPASTALSVRALERFDGRFDALWQDASAPFDFAVHRTTAYLAWRYGDPRGGRFDIRVAEESAALVGYAVLRTLRDRGHIADLVALPARGDVVQRLVTEALSRFSDPPLRAVECWLPSQHPYRDALLRRGFAVKKTKRFTYAAHAAAEAELAFLAEPRCRLHFTSGDTDLV